MSGSEPRIIKKYPNRRLYDTTVSSYITLQDVRRLVIEQTPIKVIDARSQEDITHNTLLQIIMEQEENGASLFTTESLMQMIRFYGSNMQEMFHKMFSQGMEVLSGKDPLTAISDITQKNMEQWKNLQQQWINTVNSQSHKYTAEEEVMPEESAT
jgi:polyhydroxyalkanoate synthesis repressor PhaR